MFFISLIIGFLFLWNGIIFFIKYKKYKKVFPKKIKKINLGSSHAYYAFNYINKENSLNLAELSQTLYYDEIMLNYIWDKIEKNAVCFIIFSYFSFASKERWIEEDLIKYYKILPIKYFKGSEKIECIIFRYLPLIWSIRKKLKRKFKKRKLASVIERIQGHVRYLEEERNKEFNLEILRRILNKCKEKDMKVIFLTTPFTAYYNSFFSDLLLKEKFYQNIYKLKDEYKIEYIDFSHQYKIFDKKEYFDDYDHLNEKGSSIFMKELNNILNEKILHQNK